MELSFGNPAAAAAAGAGASVAGMDYGEVIQEWLVRALVTVVIVVAFHWYYDLPFLPTELWAGQSLDQEWKNNKQKGKESLTSFETATTSSGNKLLDRLERDQQQQQRAMTKDIPTDKVEKEREPAPQGSGNLTKEATITQEEEEEEEEEEPVLMSQDTEKQDDETTKEKRDLVDEAGIAAGIAEAEESSEPSAPQEPVSVSARSSRRQQRQQQQQVPPPAASGQGQQNRRPRIKARSSDHPGLEGFCRWYGVEASLYRIYTVGRTDDEPVATPFIPRSERGHVSLNLEITNHYRRDVNVYWIDYKGRESFKYTIKPNHVFTQQTWIGHPWTFRLKDSGQLLFHYIPYRVIQHTAQVPTIDPKDPEIGIHRFTIARNTTDDECWICTIQDPVFPTHITTMQDAAAWSFQQMSRVAYAHTETLQRLLTNVVCHPSETKYRQIRTANPKFALEVWNTPARGLLLACGFVEEGAYAELGQQDQPLPRQRVQDVSTLLFYLQQWKQDEQALAEKTANSQEQQQQPMGADGSGRANYGRNNFGY